MSTILNPKRLLTRAADILDERGWCQGGFVGVEGRVCALGAINIAAAEAAGIELDRSAINGSALPEQAWESRNKAVRKLLTSAGGNLREGMGPWNDASGRTAEQVKAAMRRAAEGGAE